MKKKSKCLGRSADASLVSVSGLQTKGNKHTWQSVIYSVFASTPFHLTRRSILMIEDVKELAARNNLLRLGWYTVVQP
jgi:hypothetical protein